MALYTRKDTISSRQIFDGEIFAVRLDTLKRPDGGVLEREVVEHNGGVVILCMPSPETTLLIKQYRYAIDEDLIEFPAGRVKKGEDRLLAAKRELIEETGYSAKSWRELPAMFPAPGFCTELLTFYVATDLEWVGTNFDEDEEIEVMTISLDQAWDLAKAGKIRDCKTVAALALLRFT